MIHVALRDGPTLVSSPFDALAISLGSDMESIFQPPPHVREGAQVPSLDTYRQMYARSLQDPEVGQPQLAPEGQRQAPPREHGPSCCRGQGKPGWIDKP